LRGYARIKTDDYDKKITDKKIAGHQVGANRRAKDSQSMGRVIFLSQIFLSLIRSAG
jgi:hypothetical protein